MSIEDIAVLCPHRHQAQQIELAADQFATKDGKLLCGTVHKLQGQGKTAVIYSMTASNVHFIEDTAEFLYDSHLINVATSRSIAVCYILGNLDSLEKAQPSTLKGLELKERLREALLNLKLA
jgi:superfamily I DNA and/or RNA helicase